MSEDLSTYMVSSHAATTSVDDYDNKPPFFVWVQRKSDVLPLSSIGNDSMTTTMPTVSETGISSCSSITATASDPSSYDLIIHNTVAPDDIDKSKHHHQQLIDATSINNNNSDNNINTISTSTTSPSLLRRLSSSLGRGSVPRPPRRTTSLAIPSSTMQHRDSNDYSAQTPTSSAPSLLISRSFSLSSYYKRRFSALVTGSHGDYGLTNSKQDEAVAFWRSTVAQIEAPYSSTAVLNTEQKKYMQPMNIALQEQNNPLFTRQSSADVVTLFAHLPQLLQLSEHLIPSLEHAMAIQDSKGAARAFISLRERLVIFLRYTIHYQSNFRFIRKMCQTNPMLLHIERVRHEKETQ
ncbi:predicted protein [Lichtheimia corymbifera JMRC:FSU:9682]|uniref:DH domain-containing protein n=1 Tax=Lichtheimia corymbifera JMRC:FSU:9682 TaxID=1263082 RepID=A0A068S650_9FUNG|nr:predicted protein [Lichtheimia corymbifera JMRC:FSU:9682]